MELLDRTQLIKQLLVDQPWHLQELVVGDKFIHDLPLHPSGLCERKRRGYKGGKAKVAVVEGTRLKNSNINSSFCTMYNVPG